METKSTTLQLTETQLAEIEARTNAATEGPWDWTYHPSQDGVIALVSTSRDEDVLLCTGNDSEAWGEISEHDASFLAHARADIPALIRDWRALRAENERLLSLVDSQAASDKEEPLDEMETPPRVDIFGIAYSSPAKVRTATESAATAMRDLCVETMRLYFAAKHEYAPEALVNQLQSLTLDSREQIRNG